MNIDIYDPDFVIRCSDLAYSRDIFTVLREYGSPRMYCYSICILRGLKFQVLKFGESSPNPGESTAISIGERIKRQLEHVPGWIDDPEYCSKHGDDFYSNALNEINKGNLYPFNKNNLHIGIWNLDIRSDDVDYILFNKKDLSKRFEGMLCEQYKNTYGTLPLLNYKDPTKTKIYKSPKLSHKLWEISN